MPACAALDSGNFNQRLGASMGTEHVRGQVDDLAESTWALAVMCASAESGLLTAIASPQRVEEAAETSGMPVEIAARVLEVLVALGFARRSGDIYESVDRGPNRRGDLRPRLPATGVPVRRCLQPRPGNRFVGAAPRRQLILPAISVQATTSASRSHGKTQSMFGSADGGFVWGHLAECMFFGGSTCLDPAEQFDA
jgi:hypothetical protein